MSVYWTVPRRILGCILRLVLSSGPATMGQRQRQAPKQRVGAPHRLTGLQRILDRLGVMPEQAMCSRWQRTAAGPSHDASCIKATGLGISPLLHDIHAVTVVLKLVFYLDLCCRPCHLLHSDWGGVPQARGRQSGEGCVPCLYVTCHSMSKPRHGTPEARRD